MKETLLKLSENFYIKILFSHFALLLSWSFNGENQILLSVGSLIFLDTLTAIIAVVKLEGWAGYRSRAFSRSMSKVFRYLIFMYVARMVDKSLPIHIFAPIMDTFIVTTEASSILENFAKMGYTVPTSIVKKLKEYYTDKTAMGVGVKKE